MKDCLSWLNRIRKLPGSLLPCPTCFIAFEPSIAILRNHYRWTHRRDIDVAWCEAILAKQWTPLPDRKKSLRLSVKRPGKVLKKGTCHNCFNTSNVVREYAIKEGGMVVLCKSCKPSFSKEKLGDSNDPLISPADKPDSHGRAPPTKEPIGVRRDTQKIPPRKV